MRKLHIATGVGLLLFVATMIGGPVGMSRAQAGDGGVTLASLAGNFASRGRGSFTLYYNESFTEAVDCASACGVTDVSSTLTGTAVEIYAAKFPTRMHVRRTNVSTTTSFDSTTRSGTASFRQYREKSCSGAGFDSTDAVLAATGTQSFMASDSGSRIETILTSISYVPSSFSIAGRAR